MKEKSLVLIFSFFSILLACENKPDKNVSSYKIILRSMKDGGRVFYRANTNGGIEKRDGFYCRYTDNGKITVTGTYSNGKLDGIWYNTQKLPDEPIDGYYENDTLKKRVNGLVFDLIKDSLNRFIFFSPKGWLIKTKQDSNLLYAGVSNDTSKIVKPNFNITAIEVNPTNNSNTLSDIIKVFEGKITLVLEQDQNHMVFSITEKGINITFGVYVVKTEKHAFILTTMSSSEDYSIYKLIFKTIANSFRPF